MKARLLTWPDNVPGGAFGVISMYTIWTFISVATVCERWGWKKLVVATLNDSNSDEYFLNNVVLYITLKARRKRQLNIQILRKFVTHNITLYYFTLHSGLYLLYCRVLIYWNDCFYYENADSVSVMKMYQSGTQDKLALRHLFRLSTDLRQFGCIGVKEKAWSLYSTTRAFLFHFCHTSFT